MKSIQTAERVSRDDSDNYVYQRSLLAYHEAAKIIRGDVLEIGTGTGYGIEVLARHARSFITIDKTEPQSELLRIPNVEFRQATVPPLPFESNSFDAVVSFQVIEHIRRDMQFVAEVSRVLRSDGIFIVTTPNAPMSLTRNPWHVREYRTDELKNLLMCHFSSVESMGIVGNERVMEYYEKNRQGVERITRFDPLRLQYRLPAWMLRTPYDILNRMNRRRLLESNKELTTSIVMSDYSLVPFSDECFDLFFIAHK